MLRTSRSARAFTLIELLVVISIIALLISLLLPSLKAARDLAQLTACSSNQRLICIATNAFAADNKGHVHQTVLLDWVFWGAQGYIVYGGGIDSSNAIPATQRSWWYSLSGLVTTGQQLYPNIQMSSGYIGEITPTKKLGTVYDCPSYTGYNLRTSFPQRTDLAYGMNPYTTFRHNGLITASDPNADPQYSNTWFKEPTVKIDDIKTPSKSLLYADRVMIYQAPDPVNNAHWSDAVGIIWDDAGWGNYGWWDPSNLGNVGAIWYHNSGININCFDGSTRFFNKADCIYIGLVQDPPVFFNLNVQVGDPYVTPVY
jgi:prepilin-type N-terminal cleavage/methylation domain-containing protein